MESFQVVTLYTPIPLTHPDHIPPTIHIGAAFLPFSFFLAIVHRQRSYFHMNCHLKFQSLPYLQICSTSKVSSLLSGLYQHFAHLNSKMIQ